MGSHMQEFPWMTGGARQGNYDRGQGVVGPLIIGPLPGSLTGSSRADRGGGPGRARAGGTAQSDRSTAQGGLSYRRKA